MRKTRRRIVDAATELHATLGPAKTSIVAIAERAGVQRQTVYRHFPDDRSLFEACVEHQMSQDPPPDPELWRRMADPRSRLRVALAEVYAYFERTEDIRSNVIRDLPALPSLQAAHQRFDDHWVSLRDLLSQGWGVRGGRRAALLAAIGHALDFSTWQSLVRRQGLSTERAIEVMEQFVASIAGRS